MRDISVVSDLEIEQAVLSSLLQERNAIYEVMNLIDASCFYNEAHQRIYQAIYDLCIENKGIDLLTVTNKLRQQALLDEVGGPLFITQLSGKVSATHNLKTHAEILKELAIKRGMIKVASDIEVMAYDEETEAKDLVSKVESDLFSLNVFNTKRDAVPISVPIKGALENLDKWNSKNLTGIRTGFLQLDAATGGFQDGELIILGGRPSMGKTLLANYFIVTAAEWGTPVAFFSVEMGQDAIATRMICSLTGLSFEDVRTGLTPAQWGEIEIAAGKIEKLPIYIDDTPAIPIMELISKSRRLKMKHNIGMIVIDYLQLIVHDYKNKGANESAVIGGTVNSLKALAKELNLPVIVLCQLNREVENKGDKRPSLVNLRASGEIEQTADVVVFVHRPEYYKEPSWESNVGELLIRKNRNGRIDDLKFRHTPNLSRVYDY